MSTWGRYIMILNVQWDIPKRACCCFQKWNSKKLSKNTFLVQKIHIDQVNIILEGFCFLFRIIFWIWFSRSFLAAEGDPKLTFFKSIFPRSSGLLLKGKSFPPLSKKAWSQIENLIFQEHKRAKKLALIHGI